MAFTVTPTSGAAPYLFEAEFANAINIDSVHYSLEFYRANSVGSCPTNIVSGTSVPVAAENLLQTGSHLRNVSVEPNNCQGSLLLIRDLSSGDVISQSEVFIDNV